MSSVKEYAVEFDVNYNLDGMAVWKTQREVLPIEDVETFDSFKQNMESQPQFRKVKLMVREVSDWSEVES
jgi:hypothetical protein